MSASAANTSNIKKGKELYDSGKYSQAVEEWAAQPVGAA